MDNQHRQIKGYRELDAATVQLMNEVKQLGSQLLAKHAEVVVRLQSDLNQAERAVFASATESELQGGDGSSQELLAERDRLTAAEPLRWAAIAKTDIQTGVMALVRAIAQPAEV